MMTLKQELERAVELPKLDIRANAALVAYRDAVEFWFKDPCFRWNEL